MQDQKLLMLHWPEFPGMGKEHATFVFASKGGWYLIYGCLQTIAT